MPARSPPPNSAAAAALACSVSSAPCTSAVTSSAKRLLPGAQERLLGRLLLEVLDLLAGEEGEDRGAARPTFSSSTLSQNWWKAYGDIISGSSHSAPPSVLPYLVPSALVISGVAKRVGVAAVGAPDQLDPAGEVAPLVGAAELQRDAVLAVEVEEVHRLQQHVAELGVADARLEPALARCRAPASG